MGERERARLAWRERVDQAARAWGASNMCRSYGGEVRGGVNWPGLRPVRRRRWLLTRTFTASPHEMMDALDAALSAPRPWRSSRKPDARRRYPRSHRRWCWSCQVACRLREHDLDELFALCESGFLVTSPYRVLGRDARRVTEQAPHGRRSR